MSAYMVGRYAAIACAEAQLDKHSRARSAALDLVSRFSRLAVVAVAARQPVLQEAWRNEPRYKAVIERFENRKNSFATAYRSPCANGLPADTL